MAENADPPHSYTLAYRKYHQHHHQLAHGAAMHPSLVQHEHQHSLAGAQQPTAGTTHGSKMTKEHETEHRPGFHGSGMKCPVAVVEPASQGPTRDQVCDYWATGNSCTLQEETCPFVHSHDINNGQGSSSSDQEPATQWSFPMKDKVCYYWDKHRSCNIPEAECLYARSREGMTGQGLLSSHEEPAMPNGTDWDATTDAPWSHEQTGSESSNRDSLSGNAVPHEIPPVAQWGSQWGSPKECPGKALFPSEVDYSPAAPNMPHQSHYIRSGPGMHFTTAKKGVPGAAVNSSPESTKHLVHSAPGWNDWIQPGEAGTTSLNNRPIHPSVPAWPEAAVLTPATTPCQDNAASARGDNTAKKLEDSVSPSAVGAPLSGSSSKEILHEVVRLAVIREKVTQSYKPALTAVIKKNLEDVNELVATSAVIIKDDILLVLEDLCDMSRDSKMSWEESFQVDQLMRTTLRRLMRENCVNEENLD
ncbi:MAG: hypothetical protein Q9210_001149 [Variospora velana]